ncbi:hypothetical protein DOTSEDRAFT_74222 [Dothistroma septosporum NZE10]|uniref:Uncharacterized protein n=1 Tax=Dothistroma septosporum (strain NZE10 / CBS 128990) TaxID=675120 RepID=N1PDC6_DOTSN|nr:hypothetical protein DOTSEDRAFT_74222 [Dothistroma septosporum NZE10]
MLIPRPPSHPSMASTASSITCSSRSTSLAHLNFTTLQKQEDDDTEQVEGRLLGPNAQLIDHYLA